VASFSVLNLSKTSILNTAFLGFGNINTELTHESQYEEQE